MTGHRRSTGWFTRAHAQRVRRALGAAALAVGLLGLSANGDPAGAQTDPSRFTAEPLTDFAYVDYLADLAVRDTHQRHGIGTELIRRTR